MMNQIISTGLLAYGMSGKLFQAPFIDAHPGFKLRAVTERHEKRAEKDYPGILSYDSAAELIADPEIALVVINTPNHTHYDYARQALTAGKDILVEKPFTATAAQAQELFHLAEDKGRKIFVYQNRRWDSDFNAVRKIVSSGQLGKISEAHFRYDRYKAEIGVKAFKEEPFPASGLQFDLGPHLLDQAIALFGQPESFHKILGKNRVGTQVDDYFSIHLAYPDSIQVFVHANMLVNDIQPAFVVHGTLGSFIKERADIQEEQLLKGIKPNDAGFGLEARGKEGKLTSTGADGERSEQLVASEPASYAALFEEIYQSLVNDQPFSVTQAQVIAQLQILEAV